MQQRFICLKVKNDFEKKQIKGHSYKDCCPSSENIYCALCKLQIHFNKTNQKGFSCYGFDFRIKKETLEDLIKNKAKVLFYVSGKWSGVNNNIHYYADLVFQDNNYSDNNSKKERCKKPEYLPTEFINNEHMIFIGVRNMKKNNGRYDLNHLITVHGKVPITRATTSYTEVTTVKLI